MNALNSSAASASESQRSGPNVPTARAAARSRRRSRSIVSSTRGWRTFTATRVRLLSASRASWTCAMHPDPTGAYSKCAKSVPVDAPNARSIAASVAAAECGGTRSCSCESVMHSEVGSRSGRVDAHWPSFIRHAPPRWSAESRAASNVRSSVSPPISVRRPSTNSGGVRTNPSQTIRPIERPMTTGIQRHCRNHDAAALTSALLAPPRLASLASTSAVDVRASAISGADGRQQLVEAMKLAPHSAAPPASREHRRRSSSPAPHAAMRTCMGACGRSPRGRSPSVRPSLARKVADGGAGRRAVQAQQ